MVLDEIPFNLREEINYCVNLARTSIQDKKITFSIKVDNDVPESIISDPFRLRQVLTNLINHSVRNTKEGEIKLKCSQQHSKAAAQSHLPLNCSIQARRLMLKIWK